MSLWLAISGEWIVLLNPALWLLFLHPPILFFALRRVIRHPVPLILVVCLLSPLFSWIFSILGIHCENEILGRLGYYHSSGPGNVLLALFGWTCSFFLIPFWLAVLFATFIMVKAIQQLRSIGGKVANRTAKHPA